MFPRSILIIIIFLLSIQLHGQTHVITGTILDQKTKTPLSGATVSIKSIMDSSFIKREDSDSAGRFVFYGLVSDSFRLVVSYIGYNKIIRGIRLDTSNINMIINAVPNASQELSTVVVTARIPPVEQKGDTIQMNASQYKVNPDATGEDLVKKMPGITIENGQVKANGENVQKVTIDGRELFGDDATAALRNLPAEVIDKIQVFDRMSDQAQFTGFDDGNTNKSINVVTKSNMRNGQFGRVYAGFGTNDHYQSGGNATIFKGTERLSIAALANNINQQNFLSQDLLGVSNTPQRGGGGNNSGNRGGGVNNRGGVNQGAGGGNYGGFGNSSNFLVGQQTGINKTNSFGVNYSDIWSPKVTMTGSYFFNNAQNITDQVSNTQYFSNKLPNRADSLSSISNNNNNRVNIRFEYKIDSFNQMIVAPNLGFQNNQTSRTESTLSYFLPARFINASHNSTSNDLAGNNLNNNILFRHATYKRGRTISLNLNSSYNEKNGNIYADGLQRFFDSTGIFRKDSSTRQHTTQANNGYQLSANLVYTEPLGKTSQLQLNFNPTYSYSKADQEAFLYSQAEQKYSIFDTTLSNKFNSRYTAQNAGIAYRYGTKDNQLSLGASYQHSNLSSDRLFPANLNVDKSFENILPNAMARLKLSAHSNLRIVYRATLNQPSVTQLQDVYDITNLPYVTAGNPDLKPQYNQLLTTRYTYTNTPKGKLFVANILLQTDHNYIANGTFVPIRDSLINSKLTLSSGQQLTKPVNLNGFLSLRSFLTFAIPVLLIKSNLNFNGGISYIKLPGILNNQTNMSKTLTYNIGSVVGSNISQYIDFTISYSANYYMVRNTSEPSINSNYFQHIAQIAFNLLSKKGWFFQNDLTNQLYTGLSQGFNQNYTIWNIGAGKKFLKNQKGELKLSVFDLLKQNRSITRTVTETYIQDIQNQVLRQYFILTFTYNLRNFGTPPAKNNPNRGNRNFRDS